MHQPVLLQETLDFLITNLHGTYVDCTLGGGGHLRGLLEKLAPDARIIAIDKDLQIMQETSKTLNHPGLSFIYDDFRNLLGVLEKVGLKEVDGVMLDLGVSSFQLDMAERGFSYREDATLDMRMDSNQSLTAWDIVNTCDERALADIIRELGEEKYARSIAKAIYKHRAVKTIDTTIELADIIKGSVPAKYRRDKHPARKTFQALRMAVNGELEAISEVLPQILQVLKPGGRMCVITFHSLEDRMVKRFIQEKATDCICPPDFPVCRCSHRAELKNLTRKPIEPGEDECIANHRARSAKLRVAEKI